MAPERSRLLPVAVRVVPIWAAVVGGFAALALVGEMSAAELFRDPVAFLDAPFYTGIVSNVGVLLWCACTAICLFVVPLARRAPHPRYPAGFFGAGAALTAWLLADDGLLLHEQVFPVHLGLPAEACLLIGLLGICAFVAAFRREILAGDWPMLAAALGCFGLSVGLDLLDDLAGLSLPGAIILEDGAKLLGIALWTSYFAVAGFDVLESDRFAAPPPAASSEGGSPEDIAPAAPRTRPRRESPGVTGTAPGASGSARRSSSKLAANATSVSATKP